jgi:hypothetical protein
MLGDQQDMLMRMRAVLPTRWFPDNAPVLDGVLGGLANTWSWAFRLLSYVRAQTRIATATDIWLDIIALDFFGDRLVRRTGQGDEILRSRIRRELFRERGSREAIIAALRDLTGRAPIIFEPSRTTDTGGYSSTAHTSGGMGYGVAGGWGNLGLPFQCFITAYRSSGTGISTVSGWGNPFGGYGRGTLEYASLEMVLGQVTDDDIHATIADVLPVAAVGWTKITN